MVNRCRRVLWGRGRLIWCRPRKWGRTKGKTLFAGGQEGRKKNRKSQTIHNYLIDSEGKRKLRACADCLGGRKENEGREKGRSLYPDKHQRRDGTAQGTEGRENGKGGRSLIRGQWEMKAEFDEKNIMARHEHAVFYLVWGSAGKSGSRQRK